MVAYDIIDFLLYEWTDVVEDCLFLFTHLSSNNLLIIQYTIFKAKF